MHTVNKIETFRPARGRGRVPSRVLFIFCLLTASLLYLTAFANVASAATYYVDSNSGDDSHSKLQAQNIGTPWQTINHGTSQLSPGDILLVRGGIYRESVSIGVSGTAGNRIIIQAYPGEEPILDGTKVVTGWTQCTSQADCLGNPNWQNIYKADVAVSGSNFRLHENGKWLPISQWPDQSDPGLEEILEYKDVPNTSPAVNNYIIDIGLDQPDDYWNGAIIKVRLSAAHNYIYSSTVTDFDQASHTIYFDPFEYEIEPGFAKYSLLNHIDILDKVGEYYYVDLGGGNYRFYLWPKNVNSLADGISVTNIWGSAVGLTKDYITIEGLTIRGFSGASTYAGIGGSGADSMILRNNEIHEINGSGIYFQDSDRAIIENNRIYDIGHAFGIHFGGVAASNNIVVNNNTIDHTRQTAIYFYPVNNGNILYNKIEKTGTHGNGITAQGCSNILIAGNQVFTGSRIPCTLSGGSNIVLYNNIFSGGFYNTVATWGSNGGEVGIFNNVLHGVDGFDGLGVKGDDVVIKNNFIDGGGLNYTDRSHNIFITTSWNQGSMGVGEFVEKNLSKLFLDHNNYDFRHIGGSPAIDAGTDITADLPAFLTDPFFSDFDFGVDIDGNPRYSGGVIDIGCYENVSGPPDTTPPLPPTNLINTAQTENSISLSWTAPGPASDGDLASAYKIYRDDTLLETVTTTSFEDSGLAANTSYSYDVYSVDDAGNQSVSAATGTFSTSSDTTPPSIVSLDASETSIEITFSEPLDTISAEQTSNYSINNGISVTAASLNTDTVTLTTSAHTEGLTYTLTVVDIQDLAGNPMGQTEIDYQYNQGLVGYWRFDEGSGTTAQDSSGAGNTGTLMNGPVWTTGKVGNALSFDGIDDYIDIGNLNVEGTGLTLTAWFKADSFIASGNRLISKATGSGEQDHYWMLSTISSGGDKLRFRLKTNGSTNTLIASSGNINTDEWVHAAAVYDGGSMILYKDGAEVGTLPKTGTISINSAVPAWIGRNPGGYAPFDGMIDEVHIYNRALTADEILDLYNEGTTPDNTPPVISNVQESNVTALQATIKWNTDEASTSQVEYGLDTNYDGNSPALDANLVTSHSVLLTGLASETLYHYHVRSKDTSGNESISQDNDFTTAASTTYSLDITAVNGSVTKTPDKASYNYGETVTLETAADTGYSFANWSGAVTGSTNPATVVMNADKSVTANFAINTYTLNITAVNGSVTKTPDKASYNHGETVSLQASADTGYNFVNWTGDVTGSSNPATVVMDADKSVTANFAINTYTLSMTAENGSVTKSPDKASYNYGEEVILQATADTGYSFANWSGDVTGSSNPVTVVINADKSVTANFAINTYTLNITALNGSVTKSPDKASYNYGEEVILQAAADTGYSFANWSGAVTGSTNPATVVMNADKSVTANFAINTYTLNVTAVNGSVTKAPDKASYNYGEEVTLQAEPDTGYHFENWSGDLSGSDNPATITMTTNKSVTANFAIDEVDGTAPAVTNLSPQADSIQAPLNTLVILDITDSGDGVDANSVTINVNDNIVYSGNTNHYPSADGDCRRTGNKAAYKYIYQGNNKFEFDQTATVTVNASDLAGNAMSEYSYSFISEMRSFGVKKTLTAGKEIISSGANKDSERPLTTVSDSSGNVWVAWTEGEVAGGQIDNRDIYLGKLTVGAESFESGGVRQVTNDAHDQSNPVLAIDSSDMLYLAWQDERNGKWDLFISTSADGTTWTAEKLVTDSDSNQTNPAMAIDSSDEVYIVYDDDQNTDKDIYIASSLDNYVSKTQITSAGAVYDQTTPDIAIDSADTVYVVWADARNWNGDGKIKYDMYGAASDNSWTNIEIVDKDKDGQQTAPKIATEDSGTILHFVWVDDEPGDKKVYYGSSDGLPETPLTGTNIIDTDLPTDVEQKQPALAVTGYTGGTGDDVLKVFACWEDERYDGIENIHADEMTNLGTDIWVGDDGAGSDQKVPAIGIDPYNHPYLVWVNNKSDIIYTGSTFIEPVVLASSTVSVSSKTTVGTVPGSITNIDDVSAEVPARAYLCDVKVTISRIRNPQKPPANNRTFLYEFGPSGTTFSKPVTITIPYNATSLVSSPSAYWYNPLTGLYSQEGITDVEVIQISSGLYALRFKTTHFSIFGGGGPFGGIFGGGGGGGGGCSMSPNSQDSIAELLLPYIGLAVAMVVLKLRDRRKRKAHNITKSEC